MTPQRAKELLPVIQAFAEGKKIQSSKCIHNPFFAWVDDNSPTWHDTMEYRIRPEPREWWLVTQNGIDFFSVCSTHPDAIHVREVLE